MVTNSRTRAAVLSAAALLAALLLAACSGGAVRVSPPETTGSAAKQCAALRAALPATVMGASARDTTPKSAGTAAWGDPAITLRCGVGIPGVLDPHAATYDPGYQKHDVEEINGLCVTSEQTPDGGFRFTTVKQQTYVEVDVPHVYAGRQSPISQLAGPVLRTDPTDAKDHPFDCL